MWVAMFIMDSCTGIAFLISRDCRRSLPDFEFEIEAKLRDIGQSPPGYWYVNMVDDMTWELICDIDTEPQVLAEFRSLGV